MTPRVPADVASAGIEALRTGWLTMGPRTQQLESALTARFGSEHAIATSSGTAALHLTLLACGVGHDDSVFIPEPGPASFRGVVEAAGASRATYSVEGFEPEPDLIARIDAGTGAVIARHALGYPAELDSFAERCDELGVALIEDGREALGADGIGRGGLATILSFSSRRPISCGEGGAVLTNDEQLAERIRSLRSHAMTSGSQDRHRGHAETYDVIDVGFNYRIDEIRAAMCEAALHHLDASLRSRRETAGRVAQIAREHGAEAPREGLIERSAPTAVPVLSVSADARPELEMRLSESGLHAMAPTFADGVRGLHGRLLLIGLDDD